MRPAPAADAATGTPGPRRPRRVARRPPRTRPPCDRRARPGPTFARPARLLSPPPRATPPVSPTGRHREFSPPTPPPRRPPPAVAVFSCAGPSRRPPPSLFPPLPPPSRSATRDDRNPARQHPQRPRGDRPGALRRRLARDAKGRTDRGPDGRVRRLLPEPPADPQVGCRPSERRQARSRREGRRQAVAEGRRDRQARRRGAGRPVRGGRQPRPRIPSRLRSRTARRRRGCRADAGTGRRARRPARPAEGPAQGPLHGPQRGGGGGGAGRRRPRPALAARPVVPQTLHRGPRRRRPRQRLASREAGAAGLPGDRPRHEVDRGDGAEGRGRARRHGPLVRAGRGPAVQVPRAGRLPRRPTGSSSRSPRAAG